MLERLINRVCLEERWQKLEKAIKMLMLWLALQKLGHRHWQQKHWPGTQSSYPWRLRCGSRWPSRWRPGPEAGPSWSAAALPSLPSLSQSLSPSLSMSVSASKLPAVVISLQGFLFCGQAIFLSIFLSFFLSFLTRFAMNDLLYL